MKYHRRRLAVAAPLVSLVTLAILAAGYAAPRYNRPVCINVYTLKQFKRAAEATYQGTRLPRKGSYGHLWRYASCQRAGAGATSEARRIWHNQHAAWAERRNPAPVYVPGGGSYGDVPGVPYSFASCVAYRESTDGAGSPDIYGILPMNGYYSGMSVPAQKALFDQMYAADGTSPWSPYDGC